MELQINKAGYFTSSEIWKLMTKDRSGKDFGAPAKTYIKEKNWELKLKRRITEQAFSKSTSWGLLLEERVFELLGLDYSIVSNKFIAHPTIIRYGGTPDLVTATSVCDIKCLWLKNFCAINEITTGEELKSEYPEYYWQLISNSILTGLDKCELIVYCPKQSELNDIRALADINGVQWVVNANDNELPYIPEDSDYSNLHFIKFDAPIEDKEALIDAINNAML